MKLGRSGVTPYTLGLPILLATALVIGSSTFRQAENAANFANQLTALLLVSLGQMFTVISLGVDLSVGSVMSLASSIVATQADPLVGVALALAAAVLVGLVNGAGIAFANVHPLIMTLSVGTFVQGIAFIVLHIPGGEIPAPIIRAATGRVGGVPYALAWSVVGLVIAAFILRRTRFGLHLYAAGAMPRSAYLNGVDTQRVLLGAYVLSSLFAASAGIFLAGRVSMGDPTLGVEFIMNSLAAVAIGGVLLTGGIGSAFGVLTGVVSLGLIANGLNLIGVSPFLRSVVTGVLLLVAISFQRRRIVGL